MLHVLRRSQIVGLIAVDSSTASHLGVVEEVWLDNSGRIVYLSGNEGYLPLEQVSGISTGALSTYGRLLSQPPADLLNLDRQVVQSAAGQPIGWIEDFLFDWQTGEVMAYILAGELAEAFGGRAVLSPEDVQNISTEKVMIQEGAEQRLKHESEGLQGFLSEKSKDVQHLVKVIGDRVQHLISPHDKPDVVRVKVKEISDELVVSGHHDRNSLQEATEFLHNQWESLQQSISHAGERAKTALDAAWKQIAGH